MAVKYQSAYRWPRAIKFNPHQWSFLGLSQWVYVRDDMSKGLKIMSLWVINHGMSLSVLYIYIYKQEEKHILTLNLHFYFKVCILIIFSVLIDKKKSFFIESVLLKLNISVVLGITYINKYRCSWKPSPTMQVFSLRC